MKSSIALTLLIFILGALSAAACAGSVTERAVVQFGVLTMAANSQYEGVATQYDLYPLLLVDYGAYYFHGTKGGYQFLTRGSTTLALEIEVSSESYKAKDSDTLEGMRSRRHAAESGLVVSHTIEPGRLELRMMHDISGTYHGYSARLAYEHNPIITAAGATFLYVEGDYYNSRRSNYYFGVTESEARPGRPAHTQGSVRVLTVGIRHVYPVNQRITLLGGAGYRVFQDDLERSPIVGRKEQVQAFAAVVHRF